MLRSKLRSPISRPRRRRLASALYAGIAALLVMHVPHLAQATAYFVGEAEDLVDNNNHNIAIDDIDNARTAISPWIPAADQFISTLSTAAITTDLNAAIAKMQAGDVLIFYYSGHGSPVSDPADLTDPNIDTVDPNNLCNCDVSAAHADEQIGMGADLLAGTGVTDDQLKDIFSHLPDGSTAYVALDACFAGLAIHDNQDLGSVPVDFIGTADALHCAPGNSLFAPLFQSAFDLLGGTFKADANHDGTLTEQELFEFTSNFAGASNPTFANNDPHVDLAVAAVPEPASLSLLLIALASLAGARRRRSPGPGAA